MFDSFDMFELFIFLLFYNEFLLVQIWKLGVVEHFGRKTAPSTHQGTSRPAFSFPLVASWSFCVWFAFRTKSKTDTRRPAGQHFRIWLVAGCTPRAWFATYKKQKLTQGAAGQHF